MALNPTSSPVEMLGRGADLALDADPANRYLPWIVALMVYLAALALAGAMVLGSSAGRWHSGQSDRMTVQVPPIESSLDNAQATMDRAAAAAALLRDTAGIADARHFERHELVALLEPWLGAGNVSPELPLPGLIDVVVAPGACPDPRALELALQEIAPGARVDAHGQWLERFAATARTLQVVALIVILAIASAAAATVVFSTRTSLAVHRETIEVLHLIGAQDGFVARAFERNALWMGLRGGLIGLGLGALTFVVIGQVSVGLEGPLMPRFSLTPGGMMVLGSLPLVSAAIAMVTARFTVLRALADMP